MQRSVHVRTLSWWCKAWFSARPYFWVTRSWLWKLLLKLSPLPVLNSTTSLYCSNRKNELRWRSTSLLQWLAWLQQRMASSVRPRPSRPVHLTVTPAQQHVEINGDRPHSVEPGRRPSRLPFLTELLRSRGRRRDSYTVRHPNMQQLKSESDRRSHCMTFNPLVNSLICSVHTVALALIIHKNVCIFLKRFIFLLAAC